MAKGDNNIPGLVHGKLGDRVGRVLRGGKQIFTKLHSPTNPRTPDQQTHRNKLGFANKLSKVLAEAVNRGFERVRKSDQTARNAFVHENFYNGAIVWTEREQSRANGAHKDEETGEWGIQPELLKLAMGPRYIGMGMKAEVRDGRLYISCPDTGMNDSHGVKDDQLMVVIYRPAVPTMHLFEGPVRNECEESVYELPETEGADDVMLVYAWFQATRYHRSGGGKITVRPGEASSSVFLGTFGND